MLPRIAKLDDDIFGSGVNFADEEPVTKEIKTEKASGWRISRSSTIRYTHEVFEDFEITLNSFQNVYRLLQMRRDFTFAADTEKPKTNMCVCFFMETADEPLFFFDSEDLQPDLKEETTIADELQQNNPEIYEALLKDGVLELCCECEPAEDDS